MNQRFGYLGRFKNRAHTHVSVAYLQVRGHRGSAGVAARPCAPPRRPAPPLSRLARYSLAHAHAGLDKPGCSASPSCRTTPRSRCASSVAAARLLLPLTFGCTRVGLPRLPLPSHLRTMPRHAVFFTDCATPRFPSCRRPSRAKA